MPVASTTCVQQSCLAHDPVDVSVDAAFPNNPPSPTSCLPAIREPALLRVHSSGPLFPNGLMVP